MAQTPLGLTASKPCLMSGAVATLPRALARSFRIYFMSFMPPASYTVRMRKMSLKPE